jgi:integrase
MTKIRLKFIHQFRDANGKLYRYVRRPGMPLVRLPGLPGSPEFMAAYSAALAGSTTPVGHGFKDGTFGKLVEKYYGAVEFSNLAPRSKVLYRRVLSTQVQRFGPAPVATLSNEMARSIIEGIGAKTPGMANLTRAVLVTVFEYAIDCNMRSDNPFKRVPVYKLGTRHTWTDAELETYRKRWPLGTRERLAFAVLLYTGQRVSDAVRLKRGDVLTLTQKKTGTELTLPIHPALARAIKAGPSNGIYIIGDAAGRPMSSAALTQMMQKAIRLAGLPSACVAHGLRKAIMRQLAEHQATTKGMAAISGHKTLKEVERYSAQANQAIMAIAAMALLPDEEGTGTG